MKYILKNKDNNVLLFSITKIQKEINTITFNSFQINIESIENETLLPIDLTSTAESLHEWLSKRKIPNNRAYVEELLEAISDVDNPYKYIDVSYGLSLNDSYWICPYNDNIKWEDINLYHNNFNEIVARIAFTGEHSYINGLVTSPEFTTNGALKKCWHRYNDVVYLYKGSSERFANGGQEAVIEVYAAQVANHLGIDHVTYELTTFHNQSVSACKLFTSEDVGYIPMASVVQHLTSRNDLSQYETQLEIGMKYGMEQFEDMMVFDALIKNTDRHLNNFGLLVNNNTNEIIQAAPLFDHGNSLFYKALDSDYEDLYQVKNNISFWGMSFDTQAELYIRKRHIPMLTKMQTFSFNRVPSDILDEYKVRALETYLKERATMFIEMANRKEDY
ncbi:HipA domain-containing protein [Veillonella agrestimuris]|uniref:HipA domain-containing protein n=1 Tax=Veillonella agrestimuris TaxID=2941340 RepID=UPI00203EC22F|nr:HipA domain-containing protein [Veillonella agrestimuris]